MKTSTIALSVPLLLAASTLHAAEMFEAYPKKLSLGYVSDQVTLRYWFNPTWGLDTGVGFEDQTASAKFDDGVVIAKDHHNSNNYSLSVAAVRSIKSFPYFDLNLRAGVGYGYGKAHDNPEGPNNSSTQKTENYSFSIGPEVEIKVPYFSRLVIVSSIQAIYRVEEARTKAEDIAGSTSTTQKASTFSLSSDGNSLDEFFHIGVRYYF